MKIKYNKIVTYYINIIKEFNDKVDGEYIEYYGVNKVHRYIYYKNKKEFILYSIYGYISYHDNYVDDNIIKEILDEN